MNSIISFLILYNQYLLAQIHQLLLFVVENIPLNLPKYDITSPKYNKYTVDKLPVIKTFKKLDYKPTNYLAADEIYIKVKGIKHYVWFIMDALKKSILGYQVSSTRDVGPCILAMRMAFNKFKGFPGKALKFVSDGYSAYNLAQQQFALKAWILTLHK